VWEEVDLWSYFLELYCTIWCIVIQFGNEQQYINLIFSAVDRPRLLHMDLVVNNTWVLPQNKPIYLHNVSELLDLCLCVTSAVTCQVQQLVAGVLTTPYDVTFSDVIAGECPDDGRMLMENGLSFDQVKCTKQGQDGLLNQLQSDCRLSK